MKQKKNRELFMVVLVIVFVFPACSSIYISPLGKPPVERMPETTPPPPIPEEPQAEPSYPSETIPDEAESSYPPERVPHEIEEYDIEPPPKKEIPRIGAKTETRASSGESYMLAGVVNLIAKANDQMEQGNFDHAFATAERALRIDDANPRLWSLLAEIQLKRGNMLQAEQLANKSNLLAKGDKMLQAKNWRIIAETWHRRGRTSEADHALRKAGKLEGK